MCYTVTTLKPMNETDDRANNATNNRQKRQAVDQRVKPEELGWIDLRSVGGHDARRCGIATVGIIICIIAEE